MNKLYTRKIVLLSVIAALLAVYIVQLAFSGKNKVKVITVEDNIDLVMIDNGGEKLTISKNGDNWFVGDTKLPCQLNRANGIVNAINEIKVLGNVASGSAADYERYGFDNGIIVEAFSGEKLVRSLVVGKNTATGSQCYVRMDGKSTVCLVQGALRSTFEATADDIIEKEKEKDSEAAAIESPAL
nr:DUF4340 domain-containing protein [uncultured Treponema sp.]